MAQVVYNDAYNVVNVGVIPATMTIDPTFRVGTVDPRLFGSFAEHMGRCIYTGLHEPDHPSATKLGFRGDVLDLVAELGATIVRSSTVPTAGRSSPASCCRCPSRLSRRWRCWRS